jgi:hypothetical protein
VQPLRDAVIVLNAWNDECGAGWQTEEQAGNR